MDCEVTKPCEQYGALYTKMRFHLSGHQDVNVLVGEPRDRITDVPVFFTTPYLTGIDGYNRNIAHQTTAMGYPTVLVGPYGGVHHEDGRKPALFPETIGRTVLGMEAIYDELSESSSYDLRRIRLGESRGAMMALAGMGIEKPGSTLYADLVAPCFPRPPKLHEIPALAVQPTREAITTLRSLPHIVGKSIRELSFDRLKYLMRTGNDIRHREYILGAAGIGLALMYGKTGAFAGHIARSQPMHIRFFESDDMSMSDEWQTIFAGYPHVAVEHAPGSHMRIADPNLHSLDNTRARLKALGEELKANSTTIDFDAINQITAPTAA